MARRESVERVESVRGQVRLQGEVQAAYPEVPPEALRGEVRRVTVVGEGVLHRRCRDVAEEEFGTPALARLVDDMFATMRVAEGAGLAANQIGVDLQLFVWDCFDEDGVRHVGHILNPVLDELPAGARRLVEAEEGCLSVPGPYAALARPDRAVVRGGTWTDGRWSSRGTATSRAAFSTRPTIWAAASTSTASPPGSGARRCAAWRSARRRCSPGAPFAPRNWLPCAGRRSDPGLPRRRRVTDGSDRWRVTDGE